MKYLFFFKIIFLSINVLIPLSFLLAAIHSNTVCHAHDVKLLPVVNVRISGLLLWQEICPLTLCNGTDGAEIHKMNWEMRKILFSVTSFSCVVIWFKKKIFFIIQRVKVRAIPCESTCDTLSSSAANLGDNTVSVAQGVTATSGTINQLLPPNRVIKRNIHLHVRQIN